MESDFFVSECNSFKSPNRLCVCLTVSVCVLVSIVQSTRSLNRKWTVSTENTTQTQFRNRINYSNICNRNFVILIKRQLQLAKIKANLVDAYLHLNQVSMVVVVVSHCWQSSVFVFYVVAATSAVSQKLKFIYYKKAGQRNKSADIAEWSGLQTEYHVSVITARHPFSSIAEPVR